MRQRRQEKVRSWWGGRGRGNGEGKGEWGEHGNPRIFTAEHLSCPPCERRHMVLGYMSGVAVAVGSDRTRLHMAHRLDHVYVY